MGLGKIRSADDAVSSVISVILMTGVVVILGAVVSVFALGMAEDVDRTSPSVGFEFQVLDNGDIEVTHVNGDQINGDQLRFAGAALEKTTFGSISEWSGGDVSAGDSATVNVEASETLMVIWQSPESEETATIGEHEVPHAAAPEASIGSLDAGYYTWLRGELTIRNIQFSRVHDDNVYVVVEDEPSNGLVTYETDFSTNGGNLSVDLSPDSDIGNPETITVTVYETDSKSIELAQATAVVP
jgi:FlaG/FlaF family flagellin (archaellin)